MMPPISRERPGQHSGSVPQSLTDILNPHEEEATGEDSAALATNTTVDHFFSAVALADHRRRCRTDVAVAA